MFATRWFRSMIIRRSSGVLGLALLLSACSHDRYLFLERAELSQLEQQSEQQGQRLAALERRIEERFDAVDGQQLSLLHRLDQQQALLEALPRQRAHLLPPQPATREPSTRLGGKMIVGETESIYLADPGLIYTARIDSGATTSSLHATNIERFERDGQPWVRFDLSVPGRDETVTMEHEISRRARIIQANSEDSERRIVVELPFMIGDHRDLAEFTLSDRGHLTYPVLVGRNILRDVMLVDVGQEFVTQLPEGLNREAGANTP
ncbi:MAG: RimK/LysX family protein [Pseudomonadota bacterium]|nr:RimK/LysX family protein [Pseudomonadota bacterium]